MKTLVLLVLVAFVSLAGVVEADVTQTKVKLSFDGKKLWNRRFLKRLSSWTKKNSKNLFPRRVTAKIFR